MIYILVQPAHAIAIQNCISYIEIDDENKNGRCFVNGIKLSLFSLFSFEPDRSFSRFVCFRAVRTRRILHPALRVRSGKSREEGCRSWLLPAGREKEDDIMYKVYKASHGPD